VNHKGTGLGAGLLGGAFGLALGLLGLALGLVFALSGLSAFGIGSVYYAIGGFVVGATFIVIGVLVRRKP
jgi:hypothetical protein